MRIRLLPLLLQCLMLCSLPIAASAQSDSIQVTFITMGLSPGLTGISYKTNDKYAPIDLPLFQTTNEPYSYTGPNPMVLYRPITVDGKQKMTAIGRVRFPDGASGNYQVVVAGSANVANGSALTLAAQNFPLQSVRVFNITPYTLTVTCDTSSYTLRPGASKVTQMTQDKFGVTISVPFKGAMDDIVDGIYPITPHNRQTVFVLLTNEDKIQANPKTEPEMQLLVQTDVPPSSSDSNN